MVEGAKKVSPCEKTEAATKLTAYEKIDYLRLLQVKFGASQICT